MNERYDTVVMLVNDFYCIYFILDEKKDRKEKRIEVKADDTVMIRKVDR
jgi:hypothetical protein